MTEDEAKTKWCHAMAAESINRRDGKETCIGSSCMAWRWRPRRVLRSFKDGVTIVPVEPGQSFDSSLWFSDTVPGESDGYCGLAGREG